MSINLKTCMSINLRNICIYMDNRSKISINPFLMSRYELQAQEICPLKNHLLFNKSFVTWQICQFVEQHVYVCRKLEIVKDCIPHFSSL